MKHENKTLNYQTLGYTVSAPRKPEKTVSTTIIKDGTRDLRSGGKK